MSELDEWQGTPAENNSESSNGSREGYRSYGNRENGYSSNGRGDRPQRPRFNRSSERVTYGGNTGGERGFRPAGFGGPGEDGGAERRPSYNGGGQRPSYNNQGGYGNNRGGGYQQRPSYNNQGGYGNNRGGGYQQGGYNQGGYGNNRGGGNQRGGYNQQGGYNQGGYGNNRGGGNQRGGNNRGGNQRGGYNQQGRGGYNQQGRGGFNNNRQRGGYDPNAKYNLKKRIEYKEYIEDPDAPIRLNKFLANAGVCSRREADQFIQAGVVKVNGNVVTELGSKVLRTDEIHFHDQLVSIEKKVYVLLNKPKDYVTTSDDPQQRKTVMELVKNCCRERIYPVGRLDRNTTGVLLFTNDGDLASKLTHPKFLKKKIYHVTLDKSCTAADMQQIANGITLEDGDIHADAISYASDTDKKQIGIEIHSGKNRIVRRIFESLGYRVCKLDRVMFAGLTKKGLKRGDWRFLTEQEVAMLHMGSFE